MKNNVVRTKLGIRFISVITAMTLVAGSLAGCKLNSKDNSAAIANDAKTELLQNIMEKQVGIAHSTNKAPSKDEVVYVLADANGNRNEVIVSDWLKNTKAETTINDVTNLSNITNVSGDESFTVENSNITWNADGNDIHYQGTTDAELPVDVKVTYFLDGTEIAPDDLAGKSGKVTIRFDYTNHASKSVEIGGEEKQIYVPFTMMSGAILDNKHFNNIEVTNGRVVSTGNTNIVMGMAFPGLADSLDLDSLKEKIDDKEKADKIDESKIPDYVEITADTVDFKMDQTMTMAFSDVLSSLNLDSELDLDTQELTDSMDELEDASVKLANGSSDLNNGAGELADGAKTLAEKSLDLYDGAHKLNDGAGDLVSGANQLNDGAGSLLDGICQVDGGALALKDGAGKLDTGVSTLKSGADQLAAGTAKLSASAPQLATGAEQLASGLSTAQASISQLYLLAETAYYMPENGNYLHPDAVAAALGGRTSGTQSTLSLQTANEAASLESSINAIAESLSEDLAQYSGLASEYEAQMNECSSRIASDRETINQIVNSPSYEDIQVVTSSSDVTSEYTYTTAIYNTVNTTTNNYYSSGSVDEEGNESGDVLTNQSTDTQENSSEETGTGTYSYTQYEIGTTQVASYDMGALMGAVDALVSDCDALSNAKASYYAYSEIANYLNGYLSSLNAICSDASQLTETASLSEESVTLADTQAREAAEQLQEAADKQNEATTKLTQGLYALNTSMSATLPKVNQLADGAKQASLGAAELNSGASKLAKGADELKAGTSSLVTGTGTLKDGTTKLASGAGELKDGTARLSEGTVTLKNGTMDLEDGAALFVDGTQTLYDGTLSLNDGTKELMDGMIKFKDEGIDKLTEIFGDDVQNVVDTLNVVMDAGKEYNIFSEASNDVESSVKFIYKTDAIK